MKIHYIMPMAGRGSRFEKEGFTVPKPLIEIYGKPFFYWSTQSIRKFIELASLDFVVLQEHVDKYDIDVIIKSYFPEARLHVLSDVTEGAVITCLRGVTDISDELPVVFNDCDHLFKCSAFNDFCQKKNKDNNNLVASDAFAALDKSDEAGILLTFSSSEPKYSFVAKDSAGNITRTAEKKAISNEAICGCYYFRNRNLFETYAEQYLKDCEYSEYFMSGVYNIMIRNNLTIKSMLTDFHVPFGVPAEYEIAKLNKNYLELL